MKKITVLQNESYKKLGDLFGLFFEDINHAADGGLYAELVQNRSFEYCNIDRHDYHPLTAWEKTDGVEWEVMDETPLNKENTHYLKVSAKAGEKIKNLGYNTGIVVRKGEKYDFSVYLKADKVDEKTGKACKPVKIEVYVGDGEKKYTTVAKIAAENAEWTKYEAVLEGKKTTYDGRLIIEFKGECEIKFDMVSLFPQDTYKGRKNGLRRDIAEALAEMKPKFMRFPGGCLVHDGSLNKYDRNSMYRWDRTIGKVEERPTWRSNWGYNQTLGLGYYEYFLFCEDIGAKPLPVVPGGFNPHRGDGVAIENIGEWIQDTLDLVEFANGDVDTKWGAIRKECGHPEPFGLEYLGIGNEEIGDGFFERYEYLHKAVREKYPEIKIINTAGPFPSGEGYDVGWESARKNGSDLIDEHYYSSPEWFLANMHHYDDYDENGPKVFLGEYASWGNTYYNAIVEAAYMLHLEKAKAVALACYAPMLANVDYVNWRPDMLWYNNHEVLKTPNYYVQKLFMLHQGTDELKFVTEGLDEIDKLCESDRIAGQVSIIDNDVKGRIWDVKFRDITNNVESSVPDFEVIRDYKAHPIANADTDEFELEFKFRRTEGRKGLRIVFGDDSNGNRLDWEFGGWDNWDCNVSSTKNHRGSAISHRIFHVEDMDYELKLHVKGRRIMTYVNGVMMNDTVDRLPEIEELYVATSKDANTNETIVKVVNLTGEEKEVKVVLDGETRNSVVVTEMSGNKLTDTNEFGKEELVTPIEGEAHVEGNELDYVFAPHGVTVLRFK